LLTICCCLWGEFPDQGWSSEYVRRLRDGVARHLTKPHKFICFADRDLHIGGIEFRQMVPPSWFGNLPKTYVYSPDAGLEGRVILFDLDNVIVGSLDDMAAYDGPLCVRGRLQHGRRPEPDGDMIAFDAGNVKHLWDYACSQNIVKKTEGREREFILQVAPKCDIWQEVCPGQVVSYRHHCRSAGVPKNARVVSCHGRPRPHEISESFIRLNWQ
jgi:hypothetical protein